MNIKPVNLLQLIPALLILFFNSLVANATVTLPRLISDGMVLQRNTKLNIWGWAEPSESIIVKFHGKQYTTQANAQGNWVAVLDELKEGGPFDMEVKGTNTIIVKNILIGDVWICSGQSNMELPMKRVATIYSEIIEKASNDYIRHFDVSTKYNFQSTQQDFTSGSWKPTTPENIVNFTAVGYFFAHELYEKYKVPIGLIRASVGGSPAEAWLSEEALKQFPKHQDRAIKLKDPSFVAQIKESDSTMNARWYQKIWQNDQGLHSAVRWNDPGMDDKDWPTITLPGYWEDQGLKGVDGVVWYRKNMDVPSSMVGKEATLYLGCVVDCDSVFINGQFIGTTSYQYPPRIYPVPATLLKAGNNSIVVRVINRIGKGGFYKEKKYAIQSGKELVNLQGTWKYKLGCAVDSLPPSTFFHYQPGGLFNAMISPLLNFAIKGVIWYQGEANTSNAVEYAKLFPTVIADWRKHFKQGDFPFLYVQLANYMQAYDVPTESQWAELREAQLKTLKVVPNVGMAVTIDIGEWNDIHPLNKKDVGKRLALQAEKVAYGNKALVSSGPLYASSKVEGNKIIVSFTEVGGGLGVHGNGPLKGFALAGADKQFQWADAIIKGNTVIVSNKNIKQPKYVRYGWADNPSTNLMNKEGLPASPFRNE